jgi:hypothetical protein
MADETMNKRGLLLKKPASKKPCEANGAAGKGKIRKPSRPLPTERIAFERQLDILRANAIASSEERRPVRNADVAAVSDFAETTLSQANAFYVDIGLLARTPEGFLPADEVHAFAHAHQWNPDTAAHKLAPVLSRSWAGEILLPRLQFRDISETDAIAALSEEVGVGPEYRPNLEILLEYFQAANLIALDGGMVKVAMNYLNTRHGGAPQIEGAAPERRPQPATDARQPATTVTTSPTAGPSPSNVFNLNVDIHVPMEELNKWSADRITAFFAGIAAVLAAKNGGTTNTTNGE